MIPYGKQDISQQDIDAVIEVLQSDFLTQGPKVPEFEEAVSQYCGVNQGVAVNSATSALHIACLALGLSENDWMWTSPISFVASANCGLYCGARIDFVDIDPGTYNLSPVKLEEKLRDAKRRNALPKVIVVVHLCGQSAEMESIYKVAKEYGVYVIEDASHAIGGKYKDMPVGCCEYSDICVFSFHPVKIITTAEGGMAVSNQSALVDKMRMLRSHGITRDSNLMTHESDGDWYYQQLLLGYNYRMTDMQAALGVSQLRRLDEIITDRKRLFSNYMDNLKDLPIVLPYQHSYSYSSVHLFVIRLNLNELESTKKQVYGELRSRGIGVNVHYIPIHLQPYYKELGFAYGDFPDAEAYYQEAITLPLYHFMGDGNQSEVIETLKDVLLS